MIQKKLKGLEKMKVLITSETAWNAKATYTRNVYQKTVMNRKKKGLQRRI